MEPRLHLRRRFHGRSGMTRPPDPATAPRARRARRSSDRVSGHRSRLRRQHESRPAARPPPSSSSRRPCTSPTGRSTSTPRGRRYPSLGEFQKKTGVHVDYKRGHQRQRVVLREDPGAATARAVDRARHHRDDRQLALPVAPRHERAGSRSSTRARSRTSRTSSRSSAHPAWDPNREYSLPWQSGFTGIAYNDTLTDPVLSIDDLFGNPKLKGKVTRAERDGGRDVASSCSRTATTPRR